MECNNHRDSRVVHVVVVEVDGVVHDVHHEVVDDHVDHDVDNLLQNDRAWLLQLFCIGVYSFYNKVIIVDNRCECFQKKNVIWNESCLFCQYLRIFV